MDRSGKNTHKIKYVERVEIDVSLVRLELNKISTLPEFKTLMVFIYVTIHCEIANSFLPLASLAVSDGATLHATLKQQTACRTSRHTVPFWNADEVRIVRSSMEDSYIYI